MLEKLKEIIEEAKKVCKETNLKIEDSVLFDCCVRIFNTKNMQIKKDEIKENKKLTDKNIKEPATEKQKLFLEKLGYEGEVDILSKTEAKQLIKEYVEENQGGENY